MTSKMSLRALLVTSIPTVAVLLSFFWFRRKKKLPAIKAKKDAVSRETSTKAEELPNVSENKSHANISLEPEQKLSPTSTAARNNNRHTKLTPEKELLKTNGSVQVEYEESQPVEQASRLPVEDEIKVAIVNPLTSQVPHAEQNGCHTSESLPSSEDEQMIEEFSSNNHTSNTDNGILQSNKGSSQDLVLSSNVCKDSETSEKAPESVVSVSGDQELDALVNIREGSHDSAVSLSSPSPSDSVVNGGSHNNCDANSEVSSDSGKGTSVPESVILPAPADLSEYMIFEFDFPSDLCGRLIGRAGKNINVIKNKSGAEITLRKQPYVKDYQTCCVEGNHGQVTLALEQLRKKFPSKMFPEITYEQTNAIQDVPAVLSPEIMQLSLPEGVSVDVIVSSVVDANHVFVQQPTHPSYTSLEKLNYCMNLCYTGDNIVPQLPRPIEVGVICAAPMFNGWYRAQVVANYEESDEVDVKYVDYGGYMRVSSCVLRQIRSDFTMLPFQAVEAYLANVISPSDDEGFSAEACPMLEQLVQGKLLQGQIVSHEDDGVPYIQLYELLQEGAVFVNRELVNQGVARWIEMSS
jgi:A-kinase anchor protein 1